MCVSLPRMEAKFSLPPVIKQPRCGILTATKRCRLHRFGWEAAAQLWSKKRAESSHTFLIYFFTAWRAHQGDSLDKSPKLQLCHDWQLGQNTEGSNVTVYFSAFAGASCKHWPIFNGDVVLLWPLKLFFFPLSPSHQFWDTRSPNPMMSLQMPERCYCADVVGAPPEHKSASWRITMDYPCLILDLTLMFRSIPWPWSPQLRGALSCISWRTSRLSFAE